MVMLLALFQSQLSLRSAQGHHCAFLRTASFRSRTKPCLWLLLPTTASCLPQVGLELYLQWHRPEEQLHGAFGNMHHHPTVTLADWLVNEGWQAREPKAPAQGRGGGSRGEVCRGRNCLLLTGWYSLSDHQQHQYNCHFKSPSINLPPFGPTIVKTLFAKTDLSWAVMKAQQPQLKEEQFECCYSWPDRSWSCRHPVRQSWACTTPLVFPAGLPLPSAPQGCDITYPLVILVSATLASLSSNGSFQRGRMGWGNLPVYLQSLHIS